MCIRDRPQGNLTLFPRKIACALPTINHCDSLSASVLAFLLLALDEWNGKPRLAQRNFLRPYNDDVTVSWENVTGWSCTTMQYTTHSTSTPIYLSRHIRAWEKTTRDLRSSFMPLLHKPTTRTHIANHAFRCTVWNALNSYIVDSSSLAVFKSRLKTFLFCETFTPS